MTKLNRYTQCTAQRRSGDFCDDPSIEDAPFPICIKHAAQVLQFLRDYTDAFEAAPVELRLLVMDKTRVESDRRQAAAERTASRVGREFVYYVLVGKLIKIGYTANLRARLSAYPPDTRVLGYEPGGEHLEAQRLREFAAHLKHGKEWFEPCAELVDHINGVRRAMKSPPLTIAS